jgi:hypothetical protein
MYTFDVILTDKHNQEHFYHVSTYDEVIDLVDWAKTHEQKIKVTTKTKKEGK